MNTKVIFLDIDGVITSPRVGWHRFDIYAVQFLNWLCKNTEAKIVISSTWRYNHPKEEFEGFFPNNLHQDWRTDTRLLTNGTSCRGDEIKMWLDCHPEVENYIILDDDKDMLPEQMQNCVFTKHQNGLLWEHFLQIQKMFNLDKPYNADLTDLPSVDLVHDQINNLRNRKNTNKINFT